MVMLERRPIGWRYVQPRFLIHKAREKGILWCIVTGIADLAILPLAILLRIVLLTLKPFVHIRFGKFWCETVAALTIFNEMYQCEKDAGMHPRRKPILWYYWARDGNLRPYRISAKKATANVQVAKMFERLLLIPWGVNLLAHLNFMLSRGYPQFNYTPNQGNVWDKFGLYSRFPAHLKFTKSEEIKGQSNLLELGLGPQDKFICFNSRDSAYNEIANPFKPSLNRDWRFHDLRDSSIQNYLLAAQNLVERGYFAIRMGKFVKEALNSRDPRIIDYSTHWQSDFMDVFLSGHCHFFIGQGSGLTALPMAFRKPMVIVNMFPLNELRYCQYEQCVAIPKKYYSQKEGRFLKFREIYDMGIGHFEIRSPIHKTLLDDLGLQFIENTPEEIWEAALEMEQRLAGDFQAQDGDSELLARFMSIAEPHFDNQSLYGNMPPLTIGAHFLRANRDLLD